MFNFKLDPCLSGGSFKGGAIFIGGFKVFIAVMLFFFLAVGIDYRHPEEITFEDKFQPERTRIITFIIVEVFDAIFAVILIIGAIKSRSGLLISWMVFTIVFCCLAALGLILIMSGMSVTSKIVEGILAFEVFHVYFLLIVNSLRLELKEKKNQEIMVYKAMPPQLEKC